MNYFKQLVKQTYQSVIIDDYIEPISATQIFLIIQKHRKIRKRSTQHNKNQYIQDDDDLSANVQSIEEFTANKFQVNELFKQLGKEYKISEIEQKLEQLNEGIERVKIFISKNFSTYMQKIQLSMNETEKIVLIAENTKPKIKQISKKLKRLEKQKQHNQKVMQLRVKASNIKNLLSYLTLLPKIHLMKIAELKNINIPEKIKELNCYSSLNQFIKFKIDQVHQKIVDDLKEILINFQENKYRQLLIRYYELGGMGIELDKLTMGICSQMLRKFQINYFDLCLYYMKFIQNFHLICRWHHQYKIIDQFSETQKSIQNLKQPIFQLRKKIWSIMQEHLQVIISEMIDLEKYQMLELMCQVNRFIEIGERFSSTNNSGKIGEQLYLKSIGMLNSEFEKNTLSISESLMMEQNNEWSRLPVQNQFRYSGLELLLKSFVKKTENLQYKKFTQNCFCYLTNKQKKNSSFQDDWSFKKFSIENQPIELLRLRRILTNYCEFQFKDQVVICQSVFPILKYYEICSQQFFYLRLVTEKILLSMSFLTQYYMYFIFITFTASNIKNLIFNHANNLEQKYEKQKMLRSYPHLFKFVIKFKRDYQNSFQLQNIKQSKQEKKILRSRVVATQSLKYILAYFEFTLKTLKPLVKGIDDKWQKINTKCSQYQFILTEISQILYQDCISKIGNNIESILSPFTKIKWDDQDLDLDIYRIRIQNYLKDFSNKLKGMSKGQIPSKIIEDIFKLFCKFIVKSIKQTYIKIRKINQNGRNLIINLLNKIEDQFSIFYNNQNQNFTRKLIQYIEYGNEQKQQKIYEYIKRALGQYQQSIPAIFHLIQMNRHSENLTKFKIQEKQNEIIEYIRSFQNK